MWWSKLASFFNGEAKKIKQSEVPIFVILLFTTYCGCLTEIEKKKKGSGVVGLCAFLAPREKKCKFNFIGKSMPSIKFSFH